MEVLAMQVMLRALAVGNQNLNFLTNQLVARVSEQRFRLGIDLNNDALLVHRRHCVWNRLQNAGRQHSLGDGLRRPGRNVLIADIWLAHTSHSGRVCLRYVKTEGACPWGDQITNSEISTQPSPSDTSLHMPEPVRSHQRQQHLRPVEACMHKKARPHRLRDAAHDTAHNAYEKDYQCRAPRPAVL